ncbi:uroporphyrinogen-III synthase [Sphingomonas canadensis]|uniref:Uroporphyrinogen-III synthase n=1 Tax=Sphingomonas canadensis TaxID=1219257 RepID=A0ABW3H224_9SPHN|nr:uroporphyrinogen-III synthase [Sphingomonas canadensis]MCW3834928.1 uroporphyrinogen-III synthase [Sphingomonas canadensis]
MSRPIAVLRPEPGNRATADAIAARGRHAIRLPLFEVVPVAWQAPDPAGFDALILTSANALRRGGAGLAKLAALPVYAVGEATAAAARSAGFSVAMTGSAGAAELIAGAGAAGVRHALHLAGRERSVEPGGIVASAITVYASDPRRIAPEEAAALAGSVAIVQSPRAAALLGEIAVREGLARESIALVAVSDRAAAAAGTGWERILVPPVMTAEALVEAAVSLAD